MNYTGLAAMASRLIRRSGKSVKLRRKGTADGWTYSYDPVLGDTWTLDEEPYTVVHTDPGETPVDYELKAVEFDYTSLERDGTLVQADDRRFMLEASGVTPLLSDRFLVGTEELAIVKVRPLMPGETEIYFEVQCRG